MKLFILLLLSLYCHIGNTKENWDIVINNPDLVIYQSGEFKDLPEGSVPTKEDFINFLRLWQKEKTIKSNVQTTSALSEEQITEIQRELFILFSKQKISKEILLISKRNDTIAPATRIYRTIFSIQLEKDFLRVYFFELDSYKIFMNPIQTSDWAGFQETNTICQSKQIIYITEEMIFTCKMKNIPNCEKEFPEAKNAIVWEWKKKLLPKTNVEKKNSKERLQELEILRKEKLISKEEYLQKRKEILNEL